MPTKGRTQIKSYPTPLITDVLFYEIRDLSKEKSKEFNYEDPHWDKSKWPHHRLVHLQPVPDQGDNVYALFYAADYKDSDRYNWEHSKANLGGFKFDTVTRTYIVRRDQYNATTPALGTAMPDVPAGKFAASSFHLISRDQDRISQRSARAQSSIGAPELDSTYVVETRTYIDREEIVRSAYDDSVNGVLFTRQNIYIRGELYDGQPIELADDSASNWGVTSGGQLNTIEQVSDDVWVVTKQDLIPQQGLPGDTALFGGTVLKVYETSAMYSWPAVLGSDGVPEVTGSSPFEVMDWVTKDGATRNYPRPRYKRVARRLKTRARIHREWLTQAELDTAEGSAGTLNVIQDLNPHSIYYPSPLLTINLPPSLHRSGGVVSDTQTSDPFWGSNAGSLRTYPATTFTDWPDSIIADVDVKEFRGGYIVTLVRIFKPRS